MGAMVCLVEVFMLGLQLGRMFAYSLTLNYVVVVYQRVMAGEQALRAIFHKPLFYQVTAKSNWIWMLN